MKIFVGTTSTEIIKKNELGRDCIVKYILTNTTASGIVLNVYMGRNVSPNTIYRIAPKNLSLAAGESFEDNEVGLLADSFIKFSSSGEIDYYIAMRDENN